MLRRADFKLPPLAGFPHTFQHLDFLEPGISSLMGKIQQAEKGYTIPLKGESTSISTHVAAKRTVTLEDGKTGTVRWDQEQATEQGTGSN